MSLCAMLAPPLPASACGMAMPAGAEVPVPPGTAVAEFRCTPLTPQQRAGFLDLRGFSHAIRTTSPEAQVLFDQG
jgi:hypothetical protein